MRRRLRKRFVFLYFEYFCSPIYHVFLQVETSVYSSDYSKVEYNGYGYQQTDLGHPGYGGYSTAGPFPLTSPLSRPRSSKAKSQSGEFLPML